MRMGCSRSNGKRGHHINLHDIYLGQGVCIILTILRLRMEGSGIGLVMKRHAEVDSKKNGRHRQESGVFSVKA